MSTTIESQRETIKQARKDLQAAVNQLEPFDGRYVGRLSQDDLDTVKSITNTYLRIEDTNRDSVWWPFPNSIIASSTGKKPKISLETIRSDLNSLQSIIHVCDWVESFDQLDTYLQAKAAMLEAEAYINKAGREKARNPDTPEAERAYYSQWSRYF